MPKENAIDALEVSISILEAAETKIKRVIRRKRRLGEDSTQEKREQAQIARKLTRLENLQTEYEAGETVVSAPTKAEIKRVSKWLKTLRELTVQDAMLSKGFGIIKDALKEANELANSVS